MVKNIISKSISVFIATAITFSAFIFNEKPVLAKSDVTVNWDEEHQVIEGFGCSQACDVYGFEVYDFPKKEEVLDLLFSQEKGIGLSILRAEVGAGLNLPTIEPEDGVWNFEPSIGDVWIMNEAQNRGATKIISTVWSPPAWMKTNNSVTNGGRLKSDCYQKYADYLAQYCLKYKEIHGVDIYAISIANEPEYAASWQSCLWWSSQITDFVKNYLKPTFVRENVTSKIVIGETGLAWTELFMKPVLNDQDACDAVDIVAGHYYRGSVREFPLSKEKGKQIWVAETSDTSEGLKVHMDDGVKWGKLIHEFMTVADANAFVYWNGANVQDVNVNLMRMNTNDNTIITTKRLYALGNFSKFIRPGYIRISATDNPVSGVCFSAYKDEETGKFVIVAVNDSSTNRVIDINTQGFNSGILTPYVTNEEVSLKQYEDISSIDDKFTVSIGAESVVTFVGELDTLPTPLKDWDVIDNLDNWSNVYTHSGNWMIETVNKLGKHDEDNSRARRTSLDSQSIIYRFNNITDFEALIYYYKNLEGLKFYTSPDKNNWSEIEVKSTIDACTSDDWHRRIYSPTTEIPIGTNFFKVEFLGGETDWDKHLGSVKFMCDENRVPTDPLDDFSKTFDHSDNWVFESTFPENCEGDMSHIRRTSKDIGYITYYAGDNESFSDFEAKILYFENFITKGLKGFSVYTSEDNINYTKIETQNTTPLATSNGWSRIYSSPKNTLSQGTKYIKIEFSDCTYDWDKHISQVELFTN